MSQTYPSSRNRQQRPDTGEIAGKEALSTVVYRSRAAIPLSAAELQQLSTAAQNRNRAESVTGLVLYDNEHFFQWLEGPAQSVERILRSIRNDPRHTDFEVLNYQSSQSRAFGGWDMKLATLRQDVAAGEQDVLEPPREIVEKLHRRPDAAPVLLLKLNPMAARRPSAAAEASGSITQKPLGRTTAAILKNVILSTVIPRLFSEHGFLESPARVFAAHPRARELAELLVASDEAAARELIAELRAGVQSVWPLYGNLFEPAARSLGDLWNEDSCSEFDVTLGLYRMQAAVRLLSLGDQPRSVLRSPGPAVLIAPEPGEMHMFGAALDADVLWHAGWAPRCEYPTDDAALQELLASGWFDALDLSLSTAFRHDHLLPRLATTIARVRQASQNPDLLIVVGGRVFFEQEKAGDKVHADMASNTAQSVDRLILHGLAHRHDVPAETQAAH